MIFVISSYFRSPSRLLARSSNPDKKVPIVNVNFEQQIYENDSIMNFNMPLLIFSGSKDIFINGIILILIMSSKIV
jgi:hypothetical protein